MVGVTGYNLEGTYVRVRLTQSRLEMALSSVNPPSSYRLKQTGNIAEYQKSRVELGVTLISQCLCLGSVRSMHMLIHTAGGMKAKCTHTHQQDHDL